VRAKNHVCLFFAVIIANKQTDMKSFKEIIIIAIVTLASTLSVSAQENLALAEHNQKKEALLDSHFCSLCQERLTARIVSKPGITELNIDVDKHKLHVQFRERENSASDVWQVIKAAGYRLMNVQENKESLIGELYPCIHRTKEMAKKE